MAADGSLTPAPILRRAAVAEDRAALNRALSQATAARDAGQTVGVRLWLCRVVELMGCADILDPATLTMARRALGDEL